MSMKLNGNKYYSDFNNVVILVSGSRSGKDCVCNNLLDANAQVLGKDQIRDLCLASNLIESRFCKETKGDELRDLDFSNEADLVRLHDFIKKHNFAGYPAYDPIITLLETPRDKLPNLILDVTFTELCTRLVEVGNVVKWIGYNVNIVWVVSDINEAIEQNIPLYPDLEFAKFFIASTMKYLLTRRIDFINYLDGDIWIMFNVEGVDSQVMKFKLADECLDGANCFQVKRAGNDAIDVPNYVVEMIRKYVVQIP